MTQAPYGAPTETAGVRGSPLAVQMEFRLPVTTVKRRADALKRDRPSGATTERSKPSMYGSMAVELSS
jgi:hypothetical protein